MQVRWKLNTSVSWSVKKVEKWSRKLVTRAFPFSNFSSDFSFFFYAFKQSYIGEIINLNHFLFSKFFFVYEYILNKKTKLYLPYDMRESNNYPQKIIIDLIFQYNWLTTVVTITSSRGWWWGQQHHNCSWWEQRVVAQKSKKPFLHSALE